MLVPVPDMVKLISEQLEVFTSATRLSIPTGNKGEVLFENTLTQTDSRVVF